MVSAGKRYAVTAFLACAVLVAGCTTSSAPVASPQSTTTTKSSVTTRPRSTTSTRPRPSPTPSGAIPKPDPRLTPGATFPVTAARVCVSGYSSSVRSVSDAEKNAVYAEYGITSHAPDSYEVDHLISLELGGSNDIRNLWPEPYAGIGGARSKDVIENELHAAVCSARISLGTAQAEIVRWWTLPGASRPSPGSVPVTSPSPTSPATAPAAFVHPGAFCSPLGATGDTSAGTKMICSDHSASGAPYANGAHRWRSA
jgi:hypothetical protein